MGCFAHIKWLPRLPKYDVLITVLITIVQVYMCTKIHVQNWKRPEGSLSNEKVAKTTHAAARCSVQLLQRYFLKQGISNAGHTAIDTNADKGKCQNEADYSILFYLTFVMNLYTCTTCTCTCVNLIVVTHAWH